MSSRPGRKAVPKPEREILELLYRQYVRHFLVQGPSKPVLSLQRGLGRDVTLVACLCYHPLASFSLSYREAFAELSSLREEVSDESSKLLGVRELVRYPQVYSLEHSLLGLFPSSLWVFFSASEASQASAFLSMSSSRSLAMCVLARSGCGFVGLSRSSGGRGLFCSLACPHTATRVQLNSCSGRPPLSSSRSLSSPVSGSALRGFCAASVEEVQRAPDQRLVLYSKEGCCLCDGLKEKLQQVAALGSDGPLAGVRVEVRDITSNPEWEQAYQYEIPVLARVRADDTEELLPRLSPRMGLDQISKRLSAAFSR